MTCTLLHPPFIWLDLHLQPSISPKKIFKNEQLLQGFFLKEYPMSLGDKVCSCIFHACVSMSYMTTPKTWWHACTVVMKLFELGQLPFWLSEVFVICVHNLPLIIHAIWVSYSSLINVTNQKPNYICKRSIPCFNLFMFLSRTYLNDDSSCIYCIFGCNLANTQGKHPNT